MRGRDDAYIGKQTDDRYIDGNDGLMLGRQMTENQLVDRTRSQGNKREIGRGILKFHIQLTFPKV